MAKHRAPQGPPEQPGRPPHRAPEKAKEPPRKPEIARPPAKPAARPRDRFEEVRAHHDAAMEQLERAEIIHTGKMDFKLARRWVRERQEVFKKPRRRGIYTDPTLLRGCHERGRVLARSPKKEKAGQIREIQAFLQREFQRGRAEVFTAFTRTPIALANPKADEELKKFDDYFPENFEDKPEQERLAIVERVAAQLGIKDDPRTLDALVLDLEKQKSDVGFLSREQVIVAMSAQSARTDNPEEAFAAAVASSPELRREYEAYVSVWRSEHVSSVYGPEIPQVDGAKVEKLSRDASFFVVHTIEDQGLKLHLGENNLGEIHFGSMMRDVALYSVDGQPRLFIYDENADKGVVGPVDPKEVRVALGNIMIDTYFSGKFQEFSTSGTEQDPTKVADAALFGIAHKLLPEMEKGQEDLNENQHYILDNLARLFVRPDTQYVSMGDKTEFLRRVVNDPALRDEARNFLLENDFSAPDNMMTMSDFESALRERGAH